VHRRLVESGGAVRTAARGGAGMSKQPKKTLPVGVTITDFYAFLPKHKFIYAPTGDLWPIESINSVLPPVPLLDKNGAAVGRLIKPSTWLDRNRPVQAMTWAPGKAEVIADTLPGRSGWIKRPGTLSFNLYHPPEPVTGDPKGAQRWIDLVTKLYPTDAKHIISYCAFKIQKPAEKINHAIVLAGSPGIGKDTLIEPLRLGVGAANFTEASPHDIIGQWTDYSQAVVLRISEMKDQGEVDRYRLYEATKVLLAAPPDMLRINIKKVAQYYAVNVCGVFITTNYVIDGLYLPADDRRHYVAATEVTPRDFAAGFFDEFYRWLDSGGAANVVAYLAAYDLKAAGFNPKKPPEKTAAFYQMVNSGVASEVPEIRDVLDRLGEKEKPPIVGGLPAVTLAMINREVTDHDLAMWLNERRNRRTIPHRLASCGYLPVRNTGREDGLWIIEGKRQVVYARRDLTPAARFAAAEKLDAEEAHRAAARVKAFKGITETEKAEKR